MNPAPRSVTVLGSTGSVGTQTVELLAGRPERFQVRALVAGRNARLLAEQAVMLKAARAVIADPAGYAELRQALAGTGIDTAAGPEAVVEAAALPADWTMAAITGAAGLAATLAAISRGAVVALANKEALVCAGEVMLRAVRDAGATLLPVELRAQCDLPGAGTCQPRRGREDRAHRVRRSVPHRHARRDGQCHARRRAQASGLVDGRQDQHQFRHADEQGPRTDRGGAAVLAGGAADRRAGASAVGDPRHGVLPRRQRAGAAWARPTCASRSHTRWPGRNG